MLTKNIHSGKNCLLPLLALDELSTNSTEKIDDNMLVFISSTGRTKVAGNDKKISHSFFGPGQRGLDYITEKNLDKHDEHHGDKGNYGNNPLSLVEPLADELQYIHRCLSLFCFAVTGDALPHLPRPVTQKVRFQFSQRGFR